MSNRKQMDNDKRFMRLAIAEAGKGIPKGQTPFGSCIAKKNKLVAIGHNEVWKNTDITAHAEIMAIRKAGQKNRSIFLAGCTLYSTTEPCPLCFSAAHWARVSRIVYGTQIKDAKKYGFNELAVSNQELKKKGKSKVQIVPHFLEKECMELFKQWKKQKGHKPY